MPGTSIWQWINHMCITYSKCKLTNFSLVFWSPDYRFWSSAPLTPRLYVPRNCSFFWISTQRKREIKVENSPSVWTLDSGVVWPSNYNATLYFPFLDYVACPKLSVNINSDAVNSYLMSSHGWPIRRSALTHTWFWYTDYAKLFKCKPTKVSRLKFKILLRHAVFCKCPPK